MSKRVDQLIAEILSLEVRLFACQARLEADTDSEALHDLRTTVRRLRSVLRPLRGLPGIEQIEEAARAVGQLTTPLRDREVLAGWLAKQGHEAAAARRQSSLKRECPAVARSGELVRLLEVLEQFAGFIRVEQRQGLLRGLRVRIEKRMDKQWKQLREAMADPSHDRHRLRLLIKRVRYAAEAYPDLSHRPEGVTARLKAAQGALGDWHDHVQWLAQAEREADLAPCIAGWRVGLARAEHEADRELKRLTRFCLK